MAIICVVLPKALDEDHPYVWSRSKFNEDCKVDYINKTSLNVLIVGCKKQRTFQIVEMHDHIGQMII